MPASAFSRGRAGDSTDNVRFYRGNRVLNYIGYDRGRLIVAVLAFYLHVSRRPDDPNSGLTAHGLKSLCVEQDVCSPGRARALLSLLRLFGYVVPAPASDRRFKLLVPTELLTDSLRQRWGALFDAIALLLPEGAAARAALDRDDFLAAFVRRGIEHYRSGLRALQFTPELRLFAERNAGLTILFSLVIAAAPDDTVPPRRPVRVSISELTRRFSVSRAHVLRLLRDAAAEGLIERTGAAQEFGHAAAAVVERARTVGLHRIPVLCPLRPHRHGGYRRGPVDPALRIEVNFVQLKINFLQLSLRLRGGTSPPTGVRQPTQLRRRRTCKSCRQNWP